MVSLLLLQVAASFLVATCSWLLVVTVCLVFWLVRLRCLREYITLSTLNIVFLLQACHPFVQIQRYSCVPVQILTTNMIGTGILDHFTVDQFYVCIGKCHFAENPLIALERTAIYLSIYPLLYTYPFL